MNTTSFSPKDLSSRTSEDNSSADEHSKREDIETDCSIGETINYLAESKINVLKRSHKEVILNDTDGIEIIEDIEPDEVRKAKRAQAM